MTLQKCEFWLWPRSPHTHCIYVGNLHICFSVTCLECVTALKTAVCTQLSAPEWMISYQCCLLLGIKSIFSSFALLNPTSFSPHTSHTAWKWLQASYKRFNAQSCHCSKQMLIKPYQNCAHGRLLSNLIEFKLIQFQFEEDGSLSS